jgi:hypothetical protein
MFIINPWIASLRGLQYIYTGKREILADFEAAAAGKLKSVFFPCKRAWVK